MNRALVFLAWRSTRNRLARQAARLRRPRYLIALLLGALYLWVVVAGRRPGADPPPLSGFWVETGAALVVAGAVAWAWIFADDRRTLAFSPAEVGFLFTGPVTRRGLVQYKLLRNQVPILFNSLLWTLFLSRGRLGTAPWLKAVAVWVLLTTLSFHRLGASFVRATVSQHGRHGFRRRVLSLLLLGAFAGGVVWSGFGIRSALARPRPPGAEALVAALRGGLAAPATTALLYPFSLLVRPLLASELSAWARAMGPAILVLLLHYGWVVRSDTAFEEAAADAALERSRRGPRARPAAGRRSFRLAARGRPAGALLWKNLVSVARSRRPGRMAAGFALVGSVAAALSFYRDGAVAEVLGWLVLTWAGFSLALGPQWVRNDLRGDLAKLDLLRTYPLSGREIVGVEATGSALVLTTVQVGMLLLAWLAFLGNGGLALDLRGRTLILAGASLCLPAMNLLAMLLQNAAAVLFPDWIRHEPGSSGRVELLGQSLLTMIASVAALAVMLAPPAAMGAGLHLLLRPALGDWAALAGLPIALILLLFEARLLTRWVGRVFERTEPSPLIPTV